MNTNIYKCTGTSRRKRVCCCPFTPVCCCYPPTPPQPTYRVTYLPNGGTGGATDANLPAGSSYTIRSAFEAGISRPNYTFTGWNTNPNGSGISYNPGDVITIQNDIVLYAQWVICPLCLVSIIYSPNGGEREIVGDYDMPAGSSYTIRSVEDVNFTRPGYLFTGWNTKHDGSGVFLAPGDVIVLTETLVLYAQWIPISGCNCVIYSANGGGGGAEDFDLTPGSQYTIRSAEDTGVVRPGYVFTGWNTDPNGSGISYQPGDVITVQGTLILYAQWVPEQIYSVIYLSNGGIGDFIDPDIPAESEYTILSAESVGTSRVGYVFTGWDTEPDGSGISYQPGDVITVQGTLVLFAQWVPEQTYSVVYLSNGGVGDFADPDIPAESEYTILSAESVGISRIGYVFTGWNTMPGGSGDAYAPGDVITITDHFVLFAQWSI